jgi:ADP-ribose pyrophosphatase YjhB (NUDIX family)
MTQLLKPIDPSFSTIDLFNALTSETETLFDEFSPEDIEETKGFTVINPDGSFYDPEKDDLLDYDNSGEYANLATDMLNSFTIRAAGVLVFDEDYPDHYLAIRKPTQNGEPALGLPCGKIQESETYLDAALRELKEETSLILDSEDLSSPRFYMSSFSAPGTGASYNYHTFMFTAKLQNLASYQFADSEEGEVVLATEEELTNPATALYPEYNKKMFAYFRELKFIGAK